jgi:hypothetical protein
MIIGITAFFTATWAWIVYEMVNSKNDNDGETD